MRKIKSVRTPGEVKAPGLYERAGRVELWLPRDGKLVVDGWVIAESYGGAEELDEFLGRWLRHVGITDEMLDQWERESSESSSTPSP